MNLPPDARCAVASLGSGSKGNGTLVRLGGELVLIDCGFSLRQARRRLNRLGVGPGDVTAILVTHEHADHVAGVAAFSLSYRIPVYASFGTRRAMDDHLPVNAFDAHTPFALNRVEVTPVIVPHDANEPTQFVLRFGGVQVGVLSDLGYVTPHVLDQFTGCDVLMMEANHDRRMLITGSYPVRLKHRVGGDYGHLSNDQAAEFLDRVGHPSQHVVIGHVSEQNNDPDVLAGVFEPRRRSLASLTMATQSGGVGWICPVRGPLGDSQSSLFGVSRSTR